MERPTDYVTEYHEFPFTPDEDQILKTRLEWSATMTRSAWEGYAHSEIDRDDFALSEFNMIDGQGVAKAIAEVYERQGRVTVLDAGCGTGNQLYSVIDRARWQYGVDRDAILADGVSDYDFSTASEMWKPRAANMSGEINYTVGDLNQQILPDKSYDVIYSYEVLVHNDEPAVIVENLWEALADGGVMFFNHDGVRAEELQPLLQQLELEGAIISEAKKVAHLQLGDSPHEPASRVFYKVCRPLSVKV